MEHRQVKLEEEVDESEEQQWIEHMRDRKIKQFEAMEEEKRKKALREKKAREAMKAMKNKASKSITNGNYTFDYDGDLMLIRRPFYDQLPSTLAAPKVSSKKAPTVEKGEEGIGKFPSQRMTQDQLMKTFFKPRKEELPVEEKLRRRRKRGGSQFFHSPIDPTGSVFDNVHVNKGVAIAEGSKAKQGGPVEFHTLSRTQYFEKLSMIKGLGQRRGFSTQRSQVDDETNPDIGTIEDTMRTQVRLNTSTSQMLPPIK